MWRSLEGKDGPTCGPRASWWGEEQTLLPGPSSGPLPGSTPELLFSGLQLALGVKSFFYAGLHPGEPASIHEKEKRTFFSLIVQMDCDENRTISRHFQQKERLTSAQTKRSTQAGDKQRQASSADIINHKADAMRGGGQWRGHPPGYRYPPPAHTPDFILGGLVPGLVCTWGGRGSVSAPHASHTCVRYELSNSDHIWGRNHPLIYHRGHKS